MAAPTNAAKCKTLPPHTDQNHQPILRRLGRNRIQAPGPAEPVRRYKCERAGELIHIGIKKLRRFDRLGHRLSGDRQSKSRSVGEFVHVAIHDASRVAFSKIVADEKKQSAVAFLRTAVVYYAGLGITIARVMTENGSCYRSTKAFSNACCDLGLCHHNWHRPHDSLNSKPPISRLPLAKDDLSGLARFIAHSLSMD